tara:strand:+ start:116790 stop:117227 length:438 start_codon:yes stop_codon:yes gene_type:complete
MIIESNKIYHSVRSRYRNAQIYLFDAQYTLTDRKLIEKAYSQYIWQMRLLGLTLWLSDKLDCDKWAWLFKGYVTLRNALSKRKHAIPVGIICYMVNGDKKKPHCINVFAHETKDGHKIMELEPQPKNGVKELTQKEKDSVWLAVF